MEFVAVDITCYDSIKDILIAELTVLGADAFEEFEGGFRASYQRGDWSESALKQMLSKYESDNPIVYRFQEVARVNWNEEWERHFDPIEVNEHCIVRAPFHEPTAHLHQVIIMPKMSFGTGHHPTTHQVMQLQMGIDHEGKSVLDVGSGTGVLAIMAKKLGAGYVAATDIDDWCRDNTIENLALNGFHDVKVQLGTIDELTFNIRFDIVIANINKNVLLAELAHYYDLLKDYDSVLLLSGFYEEDIPDINQRANNLGLEITKKSVKEKWAALQFNIIDKISV